MPKERGKRGINGRLKADLETNPFLAASVLSRAAFDPTGRSRELAESAGYAMSSIYEMMEAQAEGPLRGFRYSSIDQMLPLINHCLALSLHRLMQTLPTATPDQASRAFAQLSEKSLLVSGKPTEIVHMTEARQRMDYAQLAAALVAESDRRRQVGNGYVPQVIDIKGESIGPE